MEDDIDPMGAKDILQEGMSGRATTEEWVGALPPAAGSLSGFRRMGGFKGG